MAWLLGTFVEQTPGVTHAMLLSRDGLSLLDSDMDTVWAARLAAAVSGLASTATAIPGPEGGAHPDQVLIERPDACFLIQSTGRTEAFNNRTVDTVLCVLTEPAAILRTVGLEMGRLVDRFSRYMTVEVRTADGGGGR
ncbi:roadblock/LC7 domain-containing protein [Streptomyces sp. LBUM 1476]|nr:roadblock/LC7 domain-containing protein [Streptomyces sp. LBUM 1476]MBZ3916812.1 roadblock/LC7 domain-containing protein [Streptomyces acidiscabies]